MEILYNMIPLKNLNIPLKAPLRALSLFLVDIHSKIQTKKLYKQVSEQSN